MKFFFEMKTTTFFFSQERLPHRPFSSLFSLFRPRLCNNNVVERDERAPKVLDISLSSSSLSFVVLPNCARVVISIKRGRRNTTTNEFLDS